LVLESKFKNYYSTYQKKYLDLSKNYILDVKISITEQNYLKAIYQLGESSKQVSTNSLAEALLVKASTATDMLKKLEQKKWLNYTPYKGFNLTDKGSKQALLIIRRHRLWEFFLVKKLNINWDEVHDLAEELEHIESPMLINKLAEYLNNPLYDPHGDPIPNAQGLMPKSDRIPMSEIQKPQKLRIEAVANDGQAFLQMFTELGLQIGKIIKVVQIFAFDNSYQIIVQQQTITISNKMAQQILVVPAS
jgi:DtxR family transcriptional regulator, Mn-dependent transcriptional regulator